MAERLDALSALKPFRQVQFEEHLQGKAIDNHFSTDLSTLLDRQAFASDTPMYTETATTGFARNTKHDQTKLSTSQDWERKYSRDKTSRNGRKRFRVHLNINVSFQ